MIILRMTETVYMVGAVLAWVGLCMVSSAIVIGILELTKYAVKKVFIKRGRA